MADSMFNTNGSLSSTDPNVINAAMRATGGQTLPSSPAFKRALELSQLRNVQMQQGMAEGGQAVKNLQAYQAANPPTISGLPSNQVVTSDTGYKAVLDAQGNIVGTNVPTAPVSASVGKFADERAAFNRGEGTMLEKAALGPNIRDAFLKEYAKSKPVAEMPPMAAGAGVRALPKIPIGPAAAQIINQDYSMNTPAFKPDLSKLMASGEGVRELPPIMGGDKSVGSEMAKAATARDKETKIATVRANVSKAEGAVRAAQKTGKSTPAEIQKLLENFAKAQSEADSLLLSPEEAEAKAAAAQTWSGDVDVPGLLPNVKATAKSMGLGALDNWRNYIQNPVSGFLFGGPEAPLSKEQQDYLIYQENLQRAAGR
jgi:hypothetical protein